MIIETGLLASPASITKHQSDSLLVSTEPYRFMPERSDGIINQDCDLDTARWLVQSKEVGELIVLARCVLASFSLS
jgi:hypothetical protein